jgi:hypothetical protein
VRQGAHRLMRLHHDLHSVCSILVTVWRARPPMAKSHIGLAVRPWRSIVCFAAYLAGLFAVWLINDLVAGHRHRATLAMLKEIKMELISSALRERSFNAERAAAILEQLRKAFPEMREGASERR